MGAMEGGYFLETVRTERGGLRKFGISISISQLLPVHGLSGLRRVALHQRREPSWHAHRRQRTREQKRETPGAFHFVPKRAHMPKPLPILLTPRAAACSIRTSSARKSGNGGTGSVARLQSGDIFSEKIVSVSGFSPPGVLLACHSHRFGRVKSYARSLGRGRG